MSSGTKNQEVFKRILRAIELATKHHEFALYFVQCQLLTDQDNYINYLKEQCNEMGVELLKVDFYALIKTASVAPDFWAWRGGGVDKLISSKEAKREAINEAFRLREPTNWDEGIYQIILFERLIEEHPGSENGTYEQKREYRALQYRLGAAYHSLEKYTIAYQHYRRALEIGKLFHDFDQQGRELNALGQVSLAMGKLEESLDYFTEYLAFSEKKGDEKGQGAALGNIGLVYREMQQNETAIKYFERALTINKKTGYHDGESDNLGNLGLAYQDIGNYKNAIKYHSKAFEVSKEIGDWKRQIKDLNNIGVAYNLQGKTKNAIDYYKQALELSKNFKDRQSEKDLHIKIAHCFRVLEELDVAQDYYEKAENICQELGDDQNLCDLLIYRAELSHEFKGTKQKTT